MNFELEIIRGIQTIRSGFMDTVFQVITQLGDQMVFIAVALILYWFFNKRVAFKLAFVFIFSAVVNVVFKNIFKRPRPHVVDPSLSVGEAWGDYAFPSGHAQNTGVVATVLYREYNKKVGWIKWVLLAAVILVSISRMYLGQHYLSDVLVGLALGIGMAYLMSYVVDLMGDNEHKYGLLLTIPLVIIMVIIHLSGMAYIDSKNLYVATGGLTGFLVGYLIDKLYIKYNEHPNGMKIVYRALVGFVGVGILYFGLSAVFKGISAENGLLDALRYGLVGLFGTAGSMYLFKLLKV